MASIKAYYNGNETRKRVKLLNYMNTDIFACNDAWGKLIEMGFNVLQTDWPSAMYEYFVKKGVRNG